MNYKILATFLLICFSSSMFCTFSSRLFAPFRSCDTAKLFDAGIMFTPVATIGSQCRWFNNNNNELSYPLGVKTALTADILSVLAVRQLYKLNNLSRRGSGGGVGAGVGVGIALLGSATLASCISYGITAYGYRKEWKDLQQKR